jgi:hypothetical protein
MYSVIRKGGGGSREAGYAYRRAAGLNHLWLIRCASTFQIIGLIFISLSSNLAESQNVIARTSILYCMYIGVTNLDRTFKGYLS